MPATGFAAMTSDTLDRFVSAQASAYERAVAELRRGRKMTHWMWFVFPQLAGLGHSETARFYAIRDADEARTYLAHPVLGPRLIEATEAIVAVDGSAEAILGGVDALKLRSSLTLFAQVADEPAPFERGLARFYRGEPDPATLRLLNPRRADA